MDLLPNRACDEYLEGLGKLGFSRDQIPHLSHVSEVLNSSTGWRLVRVEGLVPEREFFEMLSKKQFPSTDFIRKREELQYTPAPDMFHDLFGHTPMITNQEFADFFQMIGEAGAKANDVQLKEIQTLYWFTVEFGLITKNSGQRRIYGSGILSSPGEVLNCLSEKVKVHPFELEVVAHKGFDIWHMQEELFEISSFEQLKSEILKYEKSRGLL
jgi:phenylalanine-4-hydroxylase